MEGRTGGHGMKSRWRCRRGGKGKSRSKEKAKMRNNGERKWKVRGITSGVESKPDEVREGA